MDSTFFALNPDTNYAPYAVYGFNSPCFGAPPGPAPAITKPVLGLTGDYLLQPTPYTLPPHPLGKSRASLAYSDAGVDTGEIVIRGGTHMDLLDETQYMPATLRGVDMVAWYTTAWLKKYVAHDPAADAMLLTQRWRNDPAAAAVDSGGDANVYSWHYRSRLDLHRAGGTSYRCENLRDGCTGLVPKGQDGWLGEYSFVAATR